MDRHFVNEIKYEANFTCNDQFQVFNTTLVKSTCFVILPNNTCNEACIELNAKVPDYSEIMGLNVTQLEHACGSDDFCNFVVNVDFFNFF